MVAEWERIQTKTFTKWVNSHLAKKGSKIENLLTDLTDGVKLIELLEVIADEKFPKYEKQPKMRIHKVENNVKALKFIKDHDVKLASIGPEDLADGNLKLTLGLIWTIILRFAIVGLSEEGLSAKEGLLLWCRRKTEPYDNVDVKDFTMSFQDGLAFCALIHRHRPDLIDYASLTPEDKLGNLNLAFDVAHKHLDVPKLLDAEDIVNMPRPDERSIMTYVAQLYSVFSSLDKLETAGRRVAKYVEFAKSLSDLTSDYEARTIKLNDALADKTSELKSADVGHDYHTTKDHMNKFNQYKRSQKRAWIAEQADLAGLFSNIQAKLSTINRPPYVPPQGLHPLDVENNVYTLGEAEKSRRKNLNQTLHQILEGYRLHFANLANPYSDQLRDIKNTLGDTDGSLEDQLSRVQGNLSQLQQLSHQLHEIKQAEETLENANIEENEHTNHTYEDLAFETEVVTKAFTKKINFLESQIAAAKDTTGLSAEKLQEFKEIFEHFDSSHQGKHSRLDFKSCLSALGIISIDFQGGDAVFESIFKRVSDGGDVIHFQQFVDYMENITADNVSAAQLKESLDAIAGGKEHLTLQDLRVASVPQNIVDYLLTVLPPHPIITDAYDYRQWVETQFH